MDFDHILEILKWLWTAIFIPIPIIIGKEISRRRRKDSLIKFLSGLPPELKMVLKCFQDNKTHTLCLYTTNSSIRQGFLPKIGFKNSLLSPKIQYAFFLDNNEII
jgi:hypothetical protein